MRRFAVVVVWAIAIASGCSGPTTPTRVPIAAATSAATQVAPTASATPGARAFPTTSGTDLAPGRYDSSPPFDFEFTFEIREPGWHSAHIHGDFFDVMRFDGPDPRAPTRWIAWAHPETIHGARDAAAADMTPRDAADLMSTVITVDATPTRAFTFAGLNGVELDFHTNLQQVPLFGSEEGDFQLDNRQDLRMGIVKMDDEMLLVMCLAPPAELQAACADQHPIIESVTF